MHCGHECTNPSFNCRSTFTSDCNDEAPPLARNLKSCTIEEELGESQRARASGERYSSKRRKSHGQATNAFPSLLGEWRLWKVRSGQAFSIDGCYVSPTFFELRGTPDLKCRLRASLPSLLCPKVMQALNAYRIAHNPSSLKCRLGHGIACLSVDIPQIIISLRDTSMIALSCGDAHTAAVDSNTFSLLTLSSYLQGVNS